MTIVYFRSHPSLQKLSDEKTIASENKKNNNPEEEKDQKPAIIARWSAYQGMMDWDAANQKCNSINMRLPTITELQKALNEGYTDQWKKDGESYWSSTKNIDGNYLKMTISNGKIYSYFPYLDYGVRCYKY